MAVAGALLAMLSFTVAACGGDDDSSSSSDSESGGTQTVKLALAAPLTAGYYPIIAANALGYFEDEGIEVETVTSDETPLQAFVENGQVDISTPGANEALFGAAEGADYKVLYDPWTNASEGIVVTDSSITSMEDLVGKQVGLGTDEDAAFLQAALEEAGIDKDDVDTAVVGEGGPTVVDALESGKIAAYGSTGNVFAILEANGVELTDITPSTLKEASSVAMIATPEYIEANGDALTGFFTAFSKGVWAGQAAPEAITAMYEQAVPEDWREPETAQATMDATFEFYKPVNPDMIGELFPERWQNANDRLVAAGELEEPVDIDTLLDDQFVAPANEWDRDEVQQQAEDWLAENGEGGSS